MNNLLRQSLYMISGLKIRFIRLIKIVLLKGGYIIKKNKNSNVDSLQFANALNEIVRYSLFSFDHHKQGAIGIIFSKDRPIQLAALLKSFFHHVKNPCALHILYNISDEKYAEGYEDIRKRYSSSEIIFQLEKNFRSDLIEILQKCGYEKIFFLVDDMLFTRSFCMNDYIDIDLDHYVPSIRLGLNLTHCYTAAASQTLPLLNEMDPKENGIKKLQWAWADGVYDWGYPLSVDGNLFKTVEVLAMAKIAVYSAPNSFECALQCFRLAFNKRQGVCYESSVVVNIPFNRVQLENNNLSGNVTQETLFRYWQEGYEIDVEKYNGINNRSAHQVLPLHLTKRMDDHLC